MIQYRVTKYDPRLRDPTGAYTADDWTSFSDIGREFAGIRLTEEVYQSVESAYVQAATTLLQEAAVTELVISDLENHFDVSDAPNNGDVFQIADIGQLLARLLRNDFWCRLSATDAFVHFGYDFYMYVGLPSECTSVRELANDLGLFIEPFESPYHSSS